MSEIELLKNFNALHVEAAEMEFKVKHSKSNEKGDALKEEYLEVQAKLKIAANELINVQDKSSSYGAWQRIIRQLNEYKYQINRARPGLKLSRNQGMIIENHLFSIIIHDLYYIAICGWDMTHIPCNLYYTTDSNDSLEIHDLACFLEEEIRVLKRIHNPNYVKLREYFDDFKKRIVARFVSFV